MAGVREWVDGTRPRTLPAAVVPVLIGSGVAAGYGRFSWWRAALALVVALALQVGVNYANDYSDGVRGSDAKRVGPVRLVAAGLAPPRQVRAAAFGCFGVAGAAGLLACALLMVNNLRDIRTDTLAGKRTLAVRLGDARSRVVYVLMLLLPFCVAALLAFFRPFTLITALTLPLARIPIRSVRAGASGPALIKTLGQTGRLQLAFGIAFAIGLAIHHL